MTSVDEFFDGYRHGLMARDERRVAGLYTVPGLILFPGQAIAVSDQRQTEQFFAAAWGQYEKVTDTQTDVRVVAEAPGSVWVDVTWTTSARRLSGSCTSSSKPRTNGRSPC